MSRRNFAIQKFRQNHTKDISVNFIGYFIGHRQAKYRDISKFSFLSLKCHFRKNDNQGEFPDFNEFTLYMIFEIFHENSHDQNGHLQKNFNNHIQGEFVKIRKYTLGIIFMIFPQKSQFRLEIENFEISRNSAYLLAQK